VLAVHLLPRTRGTAAATMVYAERNSPATLTADITLL
jgi:hypothetical protein